MGEVWKESSAAMNEMKDAWRELKQRGDASEDAPLTAPKTTGQMSAAAPSTNFSTETELLETGFTLREIGARGIRIWLGLQAIGLAFQMLLWREVSGHLADFEDAISRECSSNRLQHGVCVGEMWNVSAWEDIVLGGSSWSNTHTFQFSTTSSPPTFLIVIDPVSRTIRSTEADPAPAPHELAEQEKDLRDVRWSLEVVRMKPLQVGQPLRRYHKGPEALTFEDLSAEAQQEL